MDEQEIQSWAFKLSGYNCKIEYLEERDNTRVDLLSRIPKQLKAESIELEPGVDDTIYQPVRSGRIWHKVNF